MTHSIPLGFRFAGIACGIKKSGKDDLTMIVAPDGAVAAGVYTQNLVHAAPVAFDKARTPSSDIRVVLVNSGNANACTGERGERDAAEMARLALEACGQPADASAKAALVMSTGIIGVFLPMEKIAAGVNSAAAALGSDENAFAAASRGILTTDKGPKVQSHSLSLDGKTIRIAGMCKGAGMIGPNMATMLGVITTDAKLTPADAQKILKEVADESFNCISVEGHTSTNDTLLLLASGAAGGAPLQGESLRQFAAALREMAIHLAKQIPDDGEGATHLMAIDVTGAKSRDDARTIAQTIADSALVKTAIAGGDPNWGRIVSAAGYAGIPFDARQVSLTVNGYPLYRDGAPVTFDAKTVSTSMKSKREVDIELSVGQGPGRCRFWASDLTVEYVKFNADYST